MSACGTWCSGLAGKVVIGPWLNSILEVFSSLNDPVALKVLSKAVICHQHCGYFPGALLSLSCQHQQTLGLIFTFISYRMGMGKATRKVCISNGWKLRCAGKNCVLQGPGAGSLKLNVLTGGWSSKSCS